MKTSWKTGELPMKGIVAVYVTGIRNCYDSPGTIEANDVSERCLVDTIHRLRSSKSTRNFAFRGYIFHRCYSIKKKKKKFARIHFRKEKKRKENEESKARNPRAPHRQELQDNKSGTVNLRGHRQLNGRRIIVGEGGARLTRVQPNTELINNVVKIHLRRIARS